jgi:hypothetical protein
VSLTAPDAADPSEWHLPTYDPSNKKKYHYKLHSLDIYFWLPKDAIQFVNGIRRVLPPAQVDVLDEPGPPAAAPSISPVVQQLEKTVISDPKYSSPGPSDHKLQSFSPPPISAVSHAEPPANFAPIPYNPAAPAAPESVRHREKTPPPPDDDGVNPLAAAIAVDYQQQPFSPGFAPPPPPGHPGVASPGLAPAGFGTHPGLSRAATMPAHGLASPGLTSPYGSAFPGSPGFAPPPQHGQLGRPTPPITSPGLPGPPPPPPGGYAKFNYGGQPATPSAQGQQQQPSYNIHQQAYRPTEGEATERYNRKKMVEEQTGRFERGVGGMFKKFEKKFG